MNGQISDNKIDQVRERTDIVNLVSQYVSLKAAGRNHVGLCPFHTEKTPSFSVNAARQFFHCFGCGAGGDVFSFLMQTEGVSFPDAVRRLADRCGVDLEERPLTQAEKDQLNLREQLFRVNGLAAEYFHDNLMQHPQADVARSYMKARGYGQKAAADYRIGYALDGWSGLREHLQQQGVDLDRARTLGLLREGKQGRGDFDMFRGRLMFPIFDLSGQVVAFGGRVLDDSKPKYINSPESPIYHKGAVLFGLYQARQAMRISGDVLVVEGYFDQLALQRAGFPQAVATCGTALTIEQVQQLKRYVQRVVLVFDQDNAGKQATFKAMSVLQQEGVAAAAITLPAGDDPDSFIQKQGVAAFQSRLESARPIMELFMEETLQAAGHGVELKVRAVEQVLERIAALKSELEQDLYVKELSRRSGIDVGLLQQKLRKIGRGLSVRHAPLPPYDGVPQPYDEVPPPYDVPQDSGMAAKNKRQVVPEKQRPSIGRTEQTLLRLLLQSAAVREQFVAAEGDALIQDPEVQAVARLVIDQAGEGSCDIAGLLPQATARQILLLESLVACDPGEFTENLQQVAMDCLRSLERQSLKRRADQLWRELIPEAEKGGDTLLADRYRTELKQLQLKIKRA